MITKPKPGFFVNPMHPLSRGLVGWWIFNEGDGTRVFDNSGNNNTGVFVNLNPTTAWTGSPHGGAVDFTPSSASVNLPLGAVGNLVNGSSTVTVSAFINIQANETLGLVFSSIISANTIGIFLSNESGLIKFNARSVTGEGASAVSIAHPGIGKWFHVAGTVNYATKILRLYINGTLVGTASGTFSSDVYVLGTPGITDSIGSRDGTLLFYNGLIDDVRVYNRELYVAEIVKLASKPYENLLTNRFPKFVQSLSASTAPVQNTSRFKRRRRLLYTRY